MTNQKSTPITATLVEEGEKLNFLPKFFGSKFMRADSLSYMFMRKMDEQYKSGTWDYFELSNGGFLMAPRFEGSRHLSSPGEYPVEATLSAHDAGITLTLYILGALMTGDESDEEDLLIQRHIWLRDYAQQQPSWRAIHSFID